MANSIPKAEIGSIGGSASQGARFPEDLDREDAKVVEYIDPIETPHGKSAPMKLLEIENQRVLRFANHGAHRDEGGALVPVWQSAKQVAWILEEAGVKWALSDGTAGGMANPYTNDHRDPPAPWSIVIPDDFIQLWRDPGTGGWDPSVPFHRMAEPFCSALRETLIESARDYGEPFGETFDRGVYYCTQSGRVETAAEIRMFSDAGGHIVGQSAGIEAPLMREHKPPIHFAGLYLVSNFAEGRQETWVGDDSPTGWQKFYYDCAKPVGNILVDCIAALIRKGLGECHCHSFELAGFEQYPGEWTVR